MLCRMQRTTSPPAERTKDHCDSCFAHQFIRSFEAPGSHVCDDTRQIVEVKVHAFGVQFAEPIALVRFAVLDIGPNFAPVVYGVGDVGGHQVVVTQWPMAVFDAREVLGGLVPTVVNLFEKCYISIIDLLTTLRFVLSFVILLLKMLVLICQGARLF